MKKIVFSSSNTTPMEKYEIVIGSNLVEKISDYIDLKNYSKVFVITDDHIKPLFYNKLVGALTIPTEHISLPSGEKEKNIESIQKIWEAMHKAQCDRKSLVINLGGGVVGDMGGFAASTYMRGIDFINIPTTLLAQVDASVGGKTGINFSGIKNLIGTFDQPKAVIIDTQTLKTLPKREFLSGFAEIIKHGLIKDEEYFRQVTSKHPLEFTNNEMEDIIAKSCQIKADIVQADIQESDARKLLNFGHTIGHAIEALSLDTPTPLHHGEAISIGMFAEAKISQLVNELSIEDLNTIKTSLINAGLPVSVTQFDFNQVLTKMKSDKKTEKEIINFTLVESLGKAVCNQKVSEEIIESSLAYITQ